MSRCRSVSRVSIRAIGLSCGFEIYYAAAILLSYKYLGANPISSFQSMVKGSRRNDLKYSSSCSLWQIPFCISGVKAICLTSLVLKTGAECSLARTPRLLLRASDSPLSDSCPPVIFIKTMRTPHKLQPISQSSYRKDGVIMSIQRKITKGLNGYHRNW